jgi:hypothetical protein
MISFAQGNQTARILGLSDYPKLFTLKIRQSGGRGPIRTFCNHTWLIFTLAAGSVELHFCAFGGRQGVGGEQF